MKTKYIVPIPTPRQAEVYELATSKSMRLLVWVSPWIPDRVERVLRSLVCRYLNRKMQRNRKLIADYLGSMDYDYEDLTGEWERACDADEDAARDMRWWRNH